jgi:hypothetical protein
MPDIDDVRCKSLRRGVREVEGDDQLSLPVDRGGQYMAIIRIMQSQRRNQGRVARNEAVSNGSVHEGSGPPQTLSTQFGVVFQDVPHPFIVDLDCPPDLDQAGLRQTH